MAQRVALMFLQASIGKTLFVTIVMLDMCRKKYLKQILIG